MRDNPTQTPPSAHRNDMEYWLKRAAHWEAMGDYAAAASAFAAALRAESRLNRAPTLPIKEPHAMPSPPYANRLPARDDVQEVTYHRPPTQRELLFGYGATHYRRFPVEECAFPGTRILKKWFVAPDDGLRYYR
jgi:hypothetical protein